MHYVQHYLPAKDKDRLVQSPMGNVFLNIEEAEMMLQVATSQSPSGEYISKLRRTHQRAQRRHSLSPLPGKVFLNPVLGNPLPQRLSKPLFGGVLEPSFFTTVQPFKNALKPFIYADRRTFYSFCCMVSILWSRNH